MNPWILLATQVPACLVILILVIALIAMCRRQTQMKDLLRSLTNEMRDAGKDRYSLACIRLWIAGCADLLRYATENDDFGIDLGKTRDVMMTQMSKEHNSETRERR